MNLIFFTICEIKYQRRYAGLPTMLFFRFNFCLLRLSSVEHECFGKKQYLSEQNTGLQRCASILPKDLCLRGHNWMLLAIGHSALLP